MSAHERALSFGGGREGIPNLGLVEAAIARPYSGYYRSMARKAAALVESASKNRGFADGNKRTTLILLALLLNRSDYVIAARPGDASVGEALEDMVMSVVQNQLRFEDLVMWFERRIRRR